MAVAEIIGAAIGVLLLVIVAYILVGGTLSAAEIVANAQKDLTLQNEARIRTNIELSGISNTTTSLTFSVKNTGSETISDFSHMDLYTYTPTQGYVYNSYDSCHTCTPSDGHWTVQYPFENDYVHPNELDPDETMKILVTFTSGNIPKRFLISTSNGVYKSANV